MSADMKLKMPIQHCTKAGGCVTEHTSIVLDSNWRWTHRNGCEPNCGETDNCYLGNKWNKTICPDEKTCSAGCSLDGVSEEAWKNTYGISVDGKGQINCTFLTKTPQNGTNIGGRVYLTTDNDVNKYKMFKLLNKEFTFDVDVANLPCGLNGALYFVEMEEDGGMSKYPDNKCGAKLGTGYCDAQCPHDMKWIDGIANMKGWSSSKVDGNVGYGKHGTCCAELDVWEANRISTQMTVHSCEKPGQYMCEGIECGDTGSPDYAPSGQDRFKGVCDKNGCDLNPYRVGDKKYFGPGPDFTVDSTKLVTVVTQFITSNNTDEGELVEMRRFYKQNGKVIQNVVPSYGNYSSISSEMCSVQMTEFKDHLDVFKAKGGVKGMGEAMRRSMVLVMSLWDDNLVNMTWLDAKDPYYAPGTTPKPGADRGSCSQGSGAPAVVQKAHPKSYVTYSNIRYGEIGSTTGPPSPPSPPSGCPGGSLGECIKLCPSTPPKAFQACVNVCTQRCSPLESKLSEQKRIELV